MKISQILFEELSFRFFNLLKIKDLKKGLKQSLKGSDLKKRLD